MDDRSASIAGYNSAIVLRIFSAANQTQHREQSSELKSGFVGYSAVEYGDELTGHDDLLCFFSRNVTTNVVPGGSKRPKRYRGLIPLAGVVFVALPTLIGDVTAHFAITE